MFIGRMVAENGLSCRAVLRADELVCANTIWSPPKTRHRLLLVGFGRVATQVYLCAG